MLKPLLFLVTALFVINPAPGQETPLDSIRLRNPFILADTATQLYYTAGVGEDDFGRARA